jgi:hypothetical protein
MQPIPKEIEELQKERLTKDEYDFCGKIYKKIEKLPAQTQAHRDAILDLIKKECKRKNFSLEQAEAEAGLIIYKFYLNNKCNFLIFNLLADTPVNLIPSGIMILGEPPQVTN